MPSTTLRWLRMHDFRAGIRHQLGYGQTPTTSTLTQPVSGNEQSMYAPSNTDGSQQFAASIVGTYDCFALEHGGLAPLPKQDAQVVLPINAGETWKQVYASIRGPIGYTDQPTSLPPYVRTDYTRDPVELFFALNRNAGSGAAQWRLLRGKVFKYSADLTQPNAAQTLASLTLSDGVSVFGGPTYFMLGRASPGAVTSPGLPFITANRAQLDATVYTPNAYGFPNPSGGGTILDWTAIAGWPAGSWGGMCVYHQGRHVFFPRIAWPTDLAGQTDTHEGVKDNSRAFYSKPNDTAYDSSALFTPELSYGYGAVASFNASDLLVINHNEGGALIQGDLNAPTVRRLPGIASTHGRESVGVMTPLGYVYGVNNGGVYVVDTGGGSRLLSPFLPPSFWLPDQMAPVSQALNASDYGGTFAYWDDMILCPGNWVYHIPTDAWWRYNTATATYHAWLTSPAGGSSSLSLGGSGGIMYGIPTQPTPINSTSIVGAYRYNRSIPADAWQWAGQPTILDAGRRVQVREVIVVASANHAAGVNGGTITVTLSNPDGTDPSSTVFVLGPKAGIPQVIRQSVQAKDASQIRIVLNAQAGTGIGAPILWDVFIGYRDEQYVGAG